MKKYDTKRILSLFPPLKEIEDEDIRRKVVQVWINLIGKSEWENLEDFLHERKKTILEHLNDCARMSIAIANVVKKVWNIPIKMDYLIAAANLSDAGVFLERSPKGGIRTETGKLMPHTFTNAAEALKVGLPMEVVHAIRVHTMQSTMPPKTVEAIIAKYADMVLDDVFAVHHKRKPLLVEEKKIPYIEREEDYVKEKEH